MKATTRLRSDDKASLQRKSYRIHIQQLGARLEIGGCVSHDHGDVMVSVIHYQQVVQILF